MPDKMPDKTWLATYYDACPRCGYTPLRWREVNSVMEWLCIYCGWQVQEAPAETQLQPALTAA